ncbi:T9SS type A sorting domain-containing protein [Paraflavisolibacter sp. H34]|uniref:T9SS type A sorting domain-containing protein n=1 Tax=Huijunlia imazamoxiresistens TaxID=3127457 RepID=UPI00301A97E8
MRPATFLLCTLLMADGLAAQEKAPPGKGDSTIPYILSIKRRVPAQAVTAAATVTYRVTFSEKVRGVDGTDFNAVALSGNVRGTLATLAPEAAGTLATNAARPANADSSVYEVTVRGLAGSGLLRLDLKPWGTGITDAGGNALGGGFGNADTYSVQAVPQAGFASFTPKAPVPISSHTGDKPQAKLWFHAGKWWTVLATSGGTRIFRLEGDVWREDLKLSPAANSKADCRVHGNVVHILLFRKNSKSFLVSAEYDPVAGTYKHWSKRKTAVTVIFEPAAETATLALDGTGRMWIATDNKSDVNVRWSDAPYSSWSPPLMIATGTRSDDICAITPLRGKIGVLWSNQNTWQFGFRTHADGAAPTEWSAVERPAFRSAIDTGSGMAEDHVNVVASKNGTLYCAVKTAYDIPGKARIALLVRRPSGNWEPLYPVTSNEGTRPIVLLNEAAGKIKVAYSSLESGGDILYRESATSPISFGPPVTLFSGNYLYNYVTSTHQPYTSEVALIATNLTLGQAVTVIGTDKPPVAATTAPALPSPAAEPEGFLKTDLQVSANPFRHWTSLQYILAEESPYTLALYDSRGTKVAVLKQGTAAAGLPLRYTLDGSALPGGIYYIRLETGKAFRTLKLVRGR